MNDNYIFNNTNLNDFSYKYDFETILKLNKGKLVKIHTIYNNNSDSNNIFTGIIEFATNEYIIISNPSNGNWYIIKTEFLYYIESEENINYK